MEHVALTLHSGVAVGSSIGHAVGGWFSGGSSSAPAEASPQNTEFAQQHQQVNTAAQSGVCATDVNNFRKCMDENQGSLTICGWYLDQLKACQAAAGQY
jgi:coiled-coil-helix-coiled-coil-helix domain-containing protein 2